jgi:valyl-tRNA synthetase
MSGTNNLSAKRSISRSRNRSIPIIADDYVDPEFGSGCVKITPAHDFNDYAMGERHNLPKINIMTASAALNDAVPERFRDLDRFAARKKSCRGARGARPS